MIGELLIILASILDFLTTYIAVFFFSCSVEANIIPRLLCYRNPTLLILLIPIETTIFTLAYIIIKRYNSSLAWIVVAISYYAPFNNILFLLRNIY